MRRWFCCVLLTTWMLLGTCNTAAGVVNTGSITVNWGQKSGSVTLFRVGAPISGGYMLRQEFGGGIITKEDVASRALAQWLCERVEYEGWTLPGDDRGGAEFQRLEEGLYLIVQNGAAEGYYPFLPFLAELPCEGQWHVQANPKMEQYPTQQPRTGQGMEPFLGMAGMILSGTAGVLLVKTRKKR